MYNPFGDQAITSTHEWANVSQRSAFGSEYGMMGIWEGKMTHVTFVPPAQRVDLFPVKTNERDSSL